MLNPFRSSLGLPLRLSARLARAEMHEEMAAHLEQAIERLRRRGLDAAAARRRSASSGTWAHLQEEARDARGARWIETLAADVRFAFRHFARTPVTAITLILVLSLGIGVNSALFSILQALTLRPAPGVPADESLVRIRGKTLPAPKGRLRGRPLVDAGARTTSPRGARRSRRSPDMRIDQMVLDRGRRQRAARRCAVQFVTPNFFSTLRRSAGDRSGTAGWRTRTTRRAPSWRR